MLKIPDLSFVTKEEVLLVGGVWGSGGLGHLGRGQGGRVAHGLLHVRRLHVHGLKLALKLVHETRDLAGEERPDLW